MEEVWQSFVRTLKCSVNLLSTLSLPDVKIIAIPAAGLVYHLRHERAATSVLVGEKRFYKASVSENYSEANKTKEHGDTRFELLCDNFTLQTQVRENDVEFFLGGP